MIFLVQFGINKHSQIFQRPQIVDFEKFTRAYLFQIALEIIWLPIQTKSVTPHFFYISVRTNPSTLSGKNLRKKSMLENVCANVVKLKEGFRFLLAKKGN